jgi:hypothetical protein
VLELFILGVLVLAGLTLFGILWAVVSLVCWLIFLPFKLLGLAFKGAAFLLALPFMLLVGLLAVLLFGAGLIAFSLPALPFVLLVLGAWWLVRRARTAPASS